MKAVILCFFVFCVGSVFAQSDVSKTLKKNTDPYQSNTLQEKLFVHTDKSFYVAGEIMWFKVYDMEADTHKPLDVSKVSYVEIMSRDNSAILQAKIKMQNGSGNGSFLLPFSLNSDHYVLRAYTNWMKNAGADSYFEKPLTIVNTLKKGDAQSDTDTASYDIQFFPEGGNLINGLESVIAFKGTNQYGNGIPFSGFLLNEKNDTLIRFQPFKFGMGKFVFTPSSNAVYKAVIKVGNQIITRPLPKVSAKGYIMRLTLGSNNQLTVSIASTATSSLVYLSVHSPGIPPVLQRKLTDNGRSEFIIDKNLLAEGISRFTLTDEAQQPLCERLFYKQPKQKFGIDIKADQGSYSTRKKIQLHVNTTDSVQPVAANLSLSVFRLDSLQTIDSSDIFSSVWLGSEIRGNIESPGYYLSDSSAEVKEAMDNLLLTQGWRRFRQDDVLQPTSLSSYLPEYEGQTITASIKSAATGQPVANMRAYLSVPGEKFQFANGVSDDSGNVTFIANRFYGSGEAVIQTEDTTPNKYNITLLNPFSKVPFSTLLPPFRITEERKNPLLESSINMQIQNAYFADERQQFGLLNEKDTMVFYGKPDKRYLLDDYTRFPTMEEVMREYVAEVRISKERDNYHYLVDNMPYKEFFRETPLVLLDGVPVRNTNQIVAYNPLLVRELDVITHKYYLGNQTYNGIVSYRTYNGDAAGLELSSDAVQITLDGLQFEREFYSPRYETGPQINSRIPDFRNLLQWSPEVNTDNNGRQTVSFYASDLTGNFAVVVQGNTGSGLVGSKVIIFSVVK